MSFDLEKKTLIVIPARMASTRFYGKPLALIDGKPMIQHVVERCRASIFGQELVVATDSEEIVAACAKFNSPAMLTSANHPSGLDRVIEVALKLPQYKYYLNVQGDEPIISPKTINAVGELLQKKDCEIATAAFPISNDTDYENPHVVKVVLDNEQRALYFSRSPIPYFRNRETPLKPLKHLGIYGYRRETLLAIEKFRTHPLEIAESLEQLRFLAHGLKIYVAVVNEDSRGVDVKEDIAIVEKILKEKNGFFEYQT